MRYRLTEAAESDIVSILAWSVERFGAEARERYRALMTAAIREVASLADDAAVRPRPDLGDEVFSWHLAQSRSHPGAGTVRRPRHFLIFRREQDLLIVIRVLHDAMDLRRHLDPGSVAD